MGVVRDILAVIGCLTVAWNVWAIGGFHEGATVRAVVAGMVSLVCVVGAIKSQVQNRMDQEKQIDRIDTEREYLKLALKRKER